MRMHSLDACVCVIELVRSVDLQKLNRIKTCPAVFARTGFGRQIYEIFTGFCKRVFWPASFFSHSFKSLFEGEDLVLGKL